MRHVGALFGGGMAEVLAFVLLVGLMLVPMLNVLVGAVVGAVLSGSLGAVLGLVTGCGLSVVIAKDRMRTRRRGNGARHAGALPLRLHRTNHLTCTVLAFGDCALESAYSPKLPVKNELPFIAIVSTSKALSSSRLRLSSTNTRLRL
jgi:hypothetical protein